MDAKDPDDEAHNAQNAANACAKLASSPFCCAVLTASFRALSASPEWWKRKCATPRVNSADCSLARCAAAAASACSCAVASPAWTPDWFI